MMQNFVPVPTVPVPFLYLKRLMRKRHFSESGWNQNTDLEMRRKFGGKSQCAVERLDLLIQALKANR